MGQAARTPLSCAAEVPATFLQLGRHSLGQGLCALLQEGSTPVRVVGVLLENFSSLLGVYSGAGISALVGSWMMVFAVQDGWGGVCAVPFLPLLSKPLCGHSC